MGSGLLDFYRGKRVFVTGHTGFKGAWLCFLLAGAGAKVTGYALDPPTEPSLYHIAAVREGMDSRRGDVRDYPALAASFRRAEPEIVFHLAAQPLVLESYRQPLDTFSVNILGTAHLLECVRQIPGVRSLLNVTTDKVYGEGEEDAGRREEEPLGGRDPYSASKACSELVTGSYRASFFADGADTPAVSTARAGNVIGGGDFAPDRILPDCIRAAEKGRPILLRHPASVRPYQHVLEALYAYLLIAKGQYENPSLAGSYNIGPDEKDCIATGELAELFCRLWGGGAGWEARSDRGPREAPFLRLDNTKLKRVFGWRPRWDIGTAVEKTVEWAHIYRSGGDVRRVMESQIALYDAAWEKGAESGK